MGYATVSDMRDEGVTATQATDARLEKLIELTSLQIDKYCGWFFEPRVKTIRMSGMGVPTIEPPYPPIILDSVTIDGDDIEFGHDDMEIVGAPVSSDQVCFPRLTRIPYGSYGGFTVTARSIPVWDVGRANIELSGTWGYTEEDGTDLGRTPLEINRVCILMVTKMISGWASIEAADHSLLWRILEEKTVDQSYKLAPYYSGTFGEEGGPFTGDPVVDEILLRYMAPAGMASGGPPALPPPGRS